MKNKKYISGVIVGVILLAAGVPFLGSLVANAGDSLTEGRIAWYTFDQENLASDVENSNAATARIGNKQGLAEYSKALTYGDNRREDTDGKAIKLGEYGLELNQKNLGDNFAISYWIKPDGTLKENQAVAFIGYNNPENWYAISGGNTNTQNIKIWANDAINKTYGWKTFENSVLSANQWHHIVMMGSSENGLTTYIDNKCISTGVTDAGVAKGENQDFYLGVTYWDDEFTGYLDDVMVYNRELTAAEIERIYTDDAGAKKVLDETGVSLKDISLEINDTATIEATIPSSAIEAGAKVSYEIEDTSIATEKDGVITGLKDGETTITLTVTLEGVVKTATAKIAVVDVANRMVAKYTFDDGTLKNELSDDEATAIVTALKDYSGELSFDEDLMTAEGKSLHLGNYGLKLNKTNIGKNFTVSLWLKPDGSIATNQSVLFLGNNAPERWYAVAGNGNQNVKYWARDVETKIHNGWDTLGTTDMTTTAWHNLVLTGDGTKMYGYLDGELVTNENQATCFPLDGNNQDIYVGVTYWDPEFSGVVDDITVYNATLKEDAIKTLYENELRNITEYQFDLLTKEDKILGDNESLDQIKYNLLLPTNASTKDIAWSSSNTDIISNTGVISAAPVEDTKVTMKASLTYKEEKFEKEYNITVLSLDKSELQALITAAEAIDLSNEDNVNMNRLQEILAVAKEANTYSQVEYATTKLKSIISALATEVKEDPFPYILDPQEEISVGKGAEKQIFSIPTTVLGSVEVEYFSEDTAVATYKEGILKAVAAGKTVVTAKVTSISDGWVMEYSSAVEVIDDKTDAGDTTDKTDGGNTTDVNNGGNSSGNTSENTATTNNTSSKSSKKKTTTSSTATNNNGTKVIEDDATALASAAVPVIGTEAKKTIAEALTGKGIHVTTYMSIYTQLSDGAIIFADGSAFTADDVLILVPSTEILSDGRMIDANNRHLAVVVEGTRVLTMDRVLHTVHNTEVASEFTKEQLDMIALGQTPVTTMTGNDKVQIVSKQTSSLQPIIEANGQGITQKVQMMTKQTINPAIFYIMFFVVIATSATVVMLRRKK